MRQLRSQIVRQAWYPLRLVTEPPGADVEIKDYIDVDGPWEPIGQTPLQDVRVPLGYYRGRISKPGYAPMEFATSVRPSGRRRDWRHNRTTKAGMVPVRAGATPSVSLRRSSCRTTGSTNSR